MQIKAGNRTLDKRLFEIGIVGLLVKRRSQTILTRAQSADRRYFKTPSFGKSLPSIKPLTTAN